MELAKTNKHVQQDIIEAHIEMLSIKDDKLLIDKQVIFDEYENYQEKYKI